MGLKLESVIPWGRSLDEYIRMFDLSADDRQQFILDCAGGPSSFNAEMTRLGYKVMACDPVYQWSRGDINQRIEETSNTILEGVQANRDCYVWHDIHSPTQLMEVRMAAMRQFLEDFPAGKSEGRYVVAELPALPFGDHQFDLALCSHFLFTYSDHFSETFHLESILELCRVAREVRIFPLLKISGELSPYVDFVKKELKAKKYSVEIQPVPYEFQKDGNQMLRIRL